MSDCEKCTVKDVQLLFDDIADSTESECEKNESNMDKIDYEQWIRDNRKIKKLPMSKLMLAFSSSLDKSCNNSQKTYLQKKKTGDKN